MSAPPDAFAARLLPWYRAVRRDLPWRAHRDPYAIWVSEIMLQQTTVKAVIPYYERWMARFPTVADLAAAPYDDVHAAWSGLGYYRRAKLIHEGARWLAAHGEWPETADGWRAVPGVGPYTAGAIASVAMGERAALVDGNVERVYARVNADPSIKGALTRSAWRWAEAILPPAEDCGDFNQALMELGATVCRPRDPLCPQCPLNDVCEGFRDGEPTAYPVIVAKAPPKRIVEWLHITHDGRGRIAMRRREPGTWWEGMWALPRASSPVDDLALTVATFRYAVTEHRIEARVTVREDPVAEGEWLDAGMIGARAVPAPDRKALNLARAYIPAFGATDPDAIR